MEDWGVRFVSMELFSFHKPRKKIRSHIADLALIVGIGGLGIIISNYNKHQQQIRLFSDKLIPHNSRRFTNTSKADIRRGDMDWMNDVFYAESEFKAVSRAANATISLPFQPRAVAKNVDDMDDISLTITIASRESQARLFPSKTNKQQLCRFSDNLSSINDKVFNNTYKAVIKSGDIDGMNRSVFYREPRLKTAKKMASSLVKAFSIEISLASTLAHTVASQSSFLSQLIGRPSLQTSLRKEFKHNVLTLWLQLSELNTNEIEVGIGEHAITVTWKTLEPSPEDDWMSQFVITLPFQPKGLRQTIDDTNDISLIVTICM